ncbi:MAG TPA: ImmA/IrrE family metallo-endopeptidase [Bacteroidetes bacterium]|nr:ImmA/IrrE family metallo-endopeptidase [Bacteroidota bacterium]HIL58698.1 ImmA/IrrE family metallo-endopeptidase [Rhodothermales bacterium]
MGRKEFDIGIALAEKRAREILDDFGLTTVAEVDLRDLAFDRGLIVEAREIRGAEGRLIRRGDRAIAVVDAAITQRGKRRFVAAHELGHYELHADEPVFVCDQAAFLDWHRRRPAETEANRFAAELLMPRSGFLADGRATPTSFDAVGDLAEAYRVSLTAAAFRYVHLDVAPSALVFSRRGRIEWSVESASLPLQYIGPRRPVHRDSGAGEYFQSGRTSLEPEWTPVEAWFLDDSLVRGERYLEQCRPMPSYEACLSLIWQG